MTDDKGISEEATFHKLENTPVPKMPYIDTLKVKKLQQETID